MRNFKVLVYDADGVTIRPKSMFSNLLQDNYGVSGIEQKEFFANEFRGCILGQTDLKEALAPFLKKWKINKSMDDLLQEWFDNENAPDEILLKKIQAKRKVGIVCILASNQEKYRAKYITEEMGFKNYFDQLFFSGDLGVKKPMPEYFAKITQSVAEKNKINLLPKDFMFWDDDEGNVAAAKEFGWEAELYTTIH